MKMKAILNVLDQDGKVRDSVSVLPGQEFYIGRGEENHLSLPDDSLISQKYHAGIFTDDHGDYFVVDLGSKSGVWVNGRMEERITLKDGDIIRLGRTELLFNLKGEADHENELILEGDYGGMDGTVGGLHETLELQDIKKGDAGIEPEETPNEEQIVLFRKARRLSTINRISRMIFSQDEPEGVLDETLRLVFDELKAERGLIGVSLSGLPEDLDFVATRYSQSKKCPREFPLSRSLVSHILKKESAFLSDDLQADMRIQSKSIMQIRIRSVLAMSIPGRDGIIGFFYFDHLKETGMFSQHDLDFLVALAPHVGLAIEKATERKNLNRRLRLIQDMQEKVEKLDLRQYIPGLQSRAMRDLMELIEDYAVAPETILLTGETGSGKSFLAEYIHQRSKRKGIFQGISLPGLAPSIIESELFGHVRGAFTNADRDRIGLVEEAHRGTLFLDEIGDIDQTIQTKMLEFIDRKRFRRVGENLVREVDIRLVMATKQNLEELVKKGVFRDDLYRRINVLRIHVPPLRERRDDIPELCEYILYRLRLSAKNYPAERVSDECMGLFQRYEWPANIGELENVLKRAFYRCKEKVIQVRLLPKNIQIAGDNALSCFPSMELIQDRERQPLSAQENEELYLKNLLKEQDFNVAEAARISGLSRAYIYKRMGGFIKDSREKKG